MNDFKRKEDYFITYDNLRLYCQSWPNDKARGVLCLVHGLGEHSGRYQNIREYFLPKDWAVFAYDQRGFGKSEGKRGHIDTFQQYLLDLRDFLNHVDLCLGKGLKKRKRILIGHSMGGLIVLAYCLKFSPVTDGVITSGAALSLPPDVSKVRISLGKLLSSLVPRLTLSNEVDPTYLSHDRKVVEDYVSDPLVYRELSVKLGSELIKSMKETMELAPGLTVPSLILHGASDRLVPCQASEQFYSRVRHTHKKKLIVYPGFYHEIFNELGKEKVFADMENWLNELDG